MLQQLTARFWALIMPILIGLFVIIYIAGGVLYFQQKAEQSDIDYQVDQLNMIISRPVVLDDPDQENYDTSLQEIQIDLTEEGIKEREQEIKLELYGIAQTHGFNIDPTGSEVAINSGEIIEELVGDSGYTYQILPFDASIKGEYEDVLSLVTAMCLTPTIETLVLRDLSITRTDLETTAEMDFYVYISRKQV